MRVTEFSGQGKDVRGAVPAPQVPSLAHNRLTLTTTPQKIAVLTVGTRLVRLVAEENAVFEIVADAPTNGTLTANSELLAAGQEAFRSMPAVIDGGQQLAVWARTA